MSQSAASVFETAPPSRTDDEGEGEDVFASSDESNSKLIYTRSASAVPIYMSKIFGTGKNKEYTKSPLRQPSESSSSQQQPPMQESANSTAPHPRVNSTNELSQKLEVVAIQATRSNPTIRIQHSSDHKQPRSTKQATAAKDPVFSSSSSTSSAHTSQQQKRKRGPKAAIAVGDESELQLIDLVTKSMGDVFDKHKRFESLRYLSRLRRGLPVHLDSTGLLELQDNLHALFNEHKAKDDSKEGSVFIPRPSPTKDRLSASDIVVVAKTSPRLSLV